MSNKTLKTSSILFVLFLTYFYNKYTLCLLVHNKQNYRKHLYKHIGQPIRNLFVFYF